MRPFTQINTLSSLLNRKIDKEFESVNMRVTDCIRYSKRQSHIVFSTKFRVDRGGPTLALRSYRFVSCIVGERENGGHHAILQHCLHSYEYGDHYYFFIIITISKSTAEHHFASPIARHFDRFLPACITFLKTFFLLIRSQQARSFPESHALLIINTSVCESYEDAATTPR